MADLFRLIRLTAWLVVGLLLGAWSVLSHAETITATSTTVYKIYNIFNLTAASPSAVCSAVAAAKGQGYYVAGTSSNSTCNLLNDLYPQGTWSYGISAEPGYVCPSGQNWTLNGSSCSRPDCVSSQTRDANGICQCMAGQTLVGELCVTICPTGYHTRLPDNGQCEKDCFGDQRENTDRTCGCNVGDKSYYTGTQSQVAALQSNGDCSNGCQRKAAFFAVPLGAVGMGLNGSSSQWLSSTSTTGATCTGTATVSGVVKATLPPPAPVPAPTPEQPADPRTTPKNNADPDSCGAAGGIYYSSGGTGKCSSPTPDNAMDKQKLSAGTKTGVQTNPDGSSVETTVQQQVVSDGQGGSKTSTTTTKVTKDAGGNVTGTTSTTETSGGTLGGGGNGDGTKGFCVENPNSPICKPSSWSGDCETPPVCDGDAVQCATAKAVWEHRCVNKWAESANDLSSGVDQTKLFGDMDKATAALNNDGSKDWDVLAKFQEKRQSYLTFSSSCAPDLSFDFKGEHYQFDTTILCQLGIVVKILLHLGAFMVLIRLLTVKLF